jgi:hypothetical protein
MSAEAMLEFEYAVLLSHPVVRSVEPSLPMNLTLLLDHIADLIA